MGSNGNGKGGVMEASCHKRGVGQRRKIIQTGNDTSSAPVCALGHLPLKGKALGRRLIAAPAEKTESDSGLLRAAAPTAEDG